MVAIIGGNVLGLERSSAGVLGGNGQLGSASVGRLGSNVTVNAVTGNLVIQNQDEVLVGRGPDLNLFRTYNSLGLLNDDNGDNWRESAQRMVEVVSAGSKLRLTDWDGSQTDFVWDAAFTRPDGGNGAYVSKDGGGAYDWITAISDPNTNIVTYTYTDGDSLRSDVFDGANGGRITATRDASANQLSYTYNGNGQLSRVTTANGEYTDLVWSGNQLTQVVTRNANNAFLGARTSYGYDTSGRLSTVTTDLSPADNSVADGNKVVLTYTYDGASKRISSITETGSSGFISFTYIQVGSDYRIASVTETAADGGAATTSFAYDTTNRKTTVTDALGKATVIAYDAAGNLTSITAPPNGNGAAPQMGQFTYTANGDVASYSDGLGKITSYTYDAHGNLTESVDPAGNRMRYEYDARNRLLKKVLVVNTAGLDRLPITGFDEAYYLNANSDIRSAGELADPAQHYAVTGWHEGRNPNPLFVTNAYLSANPDVAASGVNPLDHYIQTGWREGRAPGSGATTAEFIARYVNQTTRYAYDSAGRLRFEVTSEGRVTEYVYNSLGQKISSIAYTKDFYPVGWTLSSSDNVTEAQVASWASGLGSTSAIQRTDTVYDFRGNVSNEVSYADLNVNRLSNTDFQQGVSGWWDWEGQAGMLQGSTTGVDSATGKPFHRLSFNGVSTDVWVASYSSNDSGASVQPGERLAVRVGVGTTGQPASLVLRLQYIGSQGQWIGESPDLAVRPGDAAFGTTMSGFADVPAGAAFARLIVYALAPAGRTGMTLSLTEPMIAQAIATQNSVPGYSTGITGLQESALWSSHFNKVTYTYDYSGQLLARTTSGTVGSELFTYDGLGRVRTVTDLAGAVTTTAYNDAARTTTVTLANNATRTSVYSARGEILSYTEAATGVSSEVETYKYDKLGRLRVVADALGLRDFTFYDDAGRKTGYVDAKGQLSEYRYDTAGRLVATIRYATVTSAGAIAALYDSNGQPSRATIVGARPAPSNSDHWEWNVYDGADRLVQKIETVRGAWEGQSGKVTTYTYDRLGRLDKTVESANVLSPAIVAQMMAQTPGSNLLPNAGFDGSAGWTNWNPNGILSGAPAAGVSQDLHYLRTNVVASSSNQLVSVRTVNPKTFAAAPGQQLLVQAGLEAVGSVGGSLGLTVNWVDQNGNYLSSSTVAQLSGTQSYNTQVGGIVTVPAGATGGWLELYAWTSGSGAGSFSLIEPKVSVVSQGYAQNLWQNAAFDNGTQYWNLWVSSGVTNQTGPSIVVDAEGRKEVATTFQVNATGATVQLYSDSKSFYSVTPGERLAVAETITTTGAVQKVDVWVDFFDQNDQFVGSQFIGTANGTVNHEKVSGFVPKVPANAKWMRLKAWANASALNTNATVRVGEPVVTVVPAETNLFQEANFDSGSQFWYQWGATPGIAFQTTPSVGTDAAGARAISTTFQATAANCAAGLYCDGVNLIAIEPGRRLAVSERIQGSGALAHVDVWVEFWDANNNFVSSTMIGSATNLSGNGTTVSGFVTSIPANAKWMRVLSWASASALNTNASFSVSSVMISYADAAQMTVPIFSPVHTANFAYLATPSTALTDHVARNFYSNDGLLIGQLDGEGAFTQLFYDRTGRQIKSTRYAKLAAQNLRTSGTFEQLLASVGTSASDRTERTVYDGSGRVRYTLDANLRPTEFIYDAANNIVRTIAYAGTIEASSSYSQTYIRSRIAALGLSANVATRTARSVYDTAGRLAYTIDAQGGVTGYTYDNATGLVVRTINYAGLYAATDNPATSAMDDWALANVNASADRVTRSIFDGLKRLVYAVDGAGGITEYQYDLDDRVIKELRYTAQFVVADGATVASVSAQIAAAPNAVTKSFAYDAAGQLVDSWDGAGARTHFDYNAWGQVTQTIEAVGTADEAISAVLYDSAGRVLNRVSAIGTAQQIGEYFAYDGVGNLIVAVDANNKSTSYSYDAAGRVKSVTDALGNVTSYEYNAFGDAWKVTRPNTATATPVVSYAWFDKLGRTTTARNAGGYLTKTVYSALGDIASVTRFSDVDTSTPVMDIEPQVSGTAATTSFTYDRMGRVLSTTDAEGNAQHNAPSGQSRTESYTYDALGNRITSTSRLGAVTSYTYDKVGRLIRQSVAGATSNHDAAGNVIAGSHLVTTFAYDTRGNVTDKVEGYSAVAGGAVTALRTTTYKYDGASRVTEVWHDQVTTIADDMVTLTTAVTPKEFYTFDLRGNIIKSIDAGGAQTLFYYDDLDRKTAEIRQLSASQWVYTAYTYDANGNVLSTKVYDGNAGQPAAAGGNAPAVPGGTWRQTDFTYDALGRMLTSSVIANGAVTSGKWDGANWVVDTANGGNIRTEYSYDAFGNVLTATDGNNNTTWSWYDALGRKTAQVDGEGYLTTWTYNAESSATQEIRYAAQLSGAQQVASAPTAPANDPAKRITDFTYDLNGNRLTETRHGVAAWSVDPGNGLLTQAGTDAVVAYTYNALGQAMTKTVAGVQIAAYTYDQTARLTAESRAAFTDANGSTVTPTTSYAYDALGDLVTTTQAGSASGTYQALQRVTTNRYGQGGRLISSTDAEGYVHSYYYDAMGRLKKDAYNRVVNAKNTVNSATTTTIAEAKTKTYDLGGRLLTQGVYSTVGGAFQRIDFASFKYNNFDQVTQQGAGSDSASGINAGAARYQIENQYDAAGRLVASNSGDGVWKYFGYDKAGNQTVAITSAGYTLSATTGFVTALANVSSNTLNATYTQYDKRNMATQAVEEGRELSASNVQTLTSSRAYNAFGEVASETGAHVIGSPGAVTTYTYNTMGRRIRSEAPAVETVDSAGNAYWIKPSQDFYYDLAGRTIGVRDARGTYATTGTTAQTATCKAADTGNLTTYAYLVGTGYDGGQGLIATEFHSDGGKKQTLYDVMGDARVVRDELYAAASPNLHVTEQSFNRLGQLTQVKHSRATNVADDSTRLVDSYAYDQFGQRIRHTNNLYGAAVIEKTAFDALGRTTVQGDMGGNLTTTAYTWNGTLGASGLAVTGGWSETTQYLSAGVVARTKVEASDLFGHYVSKTDLGGHATTYGYDVAGRMVTSTIGGATTSFGYFNTGRLASNTGVYGAATYSYDAAGNRLTEKLVQGAVTVKDASASYDALGRLTGWNQLAGGSGFAGSLAHKYDANGNILRTVQSYTSMQSDGAAGFVIQNAPTVFGYDTMNRLVSGDGPVKLYNAAGQLVRESSVKQVPVQVPNPDWPQDKTWGQYLTIFYDGQYWVNYSYGADGTLASVSEQTEGYTYDPVDGVATPTGVMGAAKTRSAFTYDKLGRALAQSDYDANGTTVVYSRSAAYNAAGQLTSEVTATKRDNNNTYGVTNSYNYGSGASYALGSVKSLTSVSTVNGGSATTASETTTFAWYDGAVQTQIDYTPDVNSAGTVFHTYMTNNALGQATAASIQDGRPRSVSYILDENGQVLRRDEVQAGSSLGPHELWYRFGGKQMAFTGNNYETGKLGYAASIAQRRTNQGTGMFRDGQLNGSGAANVDFTQTPDGINSYGQGSALSVWTVRAGDTLAGIAQTVWGDAALWYKLAEANGLSAGAALSEGQSLTLPAGVRSTSHNASTYKPYNSAEALGDVTPSAPRPPKNNNCGVVGAILMAVVAIAVVVALKVPVTGLFSSTSAIGGGTVAAAGAAMTVPALTVTTLSTMGAIAAGATLGAAGALASQAFGVATGIQDKFNFGAVALGALGGAVGGAFGPNGIGGGNGLFGSVGDATVRAGLNAAAASTLTQGVAVATGLQDKFSWAGVAGASLGAMAASSLHVPAISAGNRSLGAYAANLGQSAASLFANAATRSVFEGTDFGDNVLAALPDTIAQTVGDMLEYGMKGRDLSDFSDLPLVTTPINSGGSWDSDWSMRSDLQAQFDRFPGGGTIVDAGLLDTLKGIGHFLFGASKGEGTTVSSLAADANEEIIVIGNRLSRSFESYVMPAVRQSLEMAKVEAGRMILSQIGGSFVGPALGRTTPAPIARSVAQGPVDAVIGALNGVNALYHASPYNMNFSDRFATQQQLANGLIALAKDPAAPVRAGIAEVDRVNSLHGIDKAAGYAYIVSRAVSEGALAFGGGSALSGSKAGSVGRIGVEAAESVAINPRLTTRLGKWRDYQAAGGQLDMQGWVRATQGQSWGLGGRSGYGNWIRSVESTHGNSLLSNRTASLYELYTTDEQFLKYGVSQNPYTRYSGAYMADKEIFRVASGTRREMITLERQLVTQNPGPLNLEPWAVAARAAGRGQ
ncbi:MAG: DUF6531 domain-containing protein [Novosphingobium sp.]|uniref:DUF6531 domain-containing protein n=1 Tax=Novosphingobium sp. TaxID=1874826 RepID=UPI0032B80A74